MTTPSVPEAPMCPNCWRPITCHRPWCQTFQTIAEVPAQGNVIDHPTWGPTELISVYLREDAIRDGVLVDCTQDEFDELNRNAGVIFDVAMTDAVFHRYVRVPSDAQGMQDVKGRYWDILSMYRRAALEHPEKNEVLFEFLCMPNGAGIWANELRSSSPQHRLVQLKAVTGPGDRSEPCLTFMLPSDD